MHLCIHMYLFEDIGEGQIGSVVLHQPHLGGYSHHPWHSKSLSDADMSPGEGRREKEESSNYVQQSKRRRTNKDFIAEVSQTLSFSRKRLTMLSSCSTLSSDRQRDACVSLRTRYG